MVVFAARAQSALQVYSVFVVTIDGYCGCAPTRLISVDDDGTLGFVGKLAGFFMFDSGFVVNESR